MANQIKYIAFNVEQKKRVNLGGGSVVNLPRINLNRGDTYEFRFLLYSDRYNFYAQTGGTWTLQLREKRQSLSTDDLAEAADGAFVDATWSAGIKTLPVKELQKVNNTGFVEGDKIIGFTSGAIGYVLGFSDNGILVINHESGTWASGELVRVIDAGGGYTGIEARSGSTATAIQGAKVSGRPICTMSLEVSALNTLLVDKEFANCILELTETNTGVVKVIGQCEVRVNNTFDL